MRDPNRVQLQMAIDPAEKDLIRLLARSGRQTMTGFVLRLVHEEAERRQASAAATGVAAQT